MKIIAYLVKYNIFRTEFVYISILKVLNSYSQLIYYNSCSNFLLHPQEIFVPKLKILKILYTLHHWQATVYGGKLDWRAVLYEYV